MRAVERATASNIVIVRLSTERNAGVSRLGIEVPRLVGSHYRLNTIDPDLYESRRKGTFRAVTASARDVSL